MMLSEEKEKWLEMRRKTITDYFDVPQSEQGKIDAVFNDMAELANRCANQGEFEQELLKSPVNTAYNNLFAGIAKYAKMPGGSPTSTMAQGVVTGTISGVVKQKARSGLIGWLVNLLPSWITDWWVYREHNIPGVNQVKGAMNTYDQFAGRAKRSHQAAQDQEQLRKEIDEQNRQMQEQQAAYERLVKEQQEAAQKEMDKYK